MAPRVYSTPYFQPYTFYFVALSAFRSHFANNLEGIDNPFEALGASLFVFAQVLWTWRDPPSGSIPWFSNWGKYLLLLCCITLSSSREKPTQTREVTRRIPSAKEGLLLPYQKNFWCRCLGGSSQELIKVGVANSYLAFTLFASCLSFSSPPLHRFAFFVCLCRSPFFSPALCFLVCLLACWSHHEWKHQSLWLLEY